MSTVTESIDVDVTTVYNQWTLGILDRRVKGDMKRFKDFIENRDGAETGGWRGQVDRPGA